MGSIRRLVRNGELITRGETLVAVIFMDRKLDTDQPERGYGKETYSRKTHRSCGRQNQNHFVHGGHIQLVRGFLGKISVFDNDISNPTRGHARSKHP